MSINLAEMANNRERAMALINAGGATKQSLMEQLNVSDKSLASLFAQLRLMGHYPIKNEDGTYRLGDLAEYEASKPEPKAKAEPKFLTKEQRIERAEKRETRAATAATNAAKAYEANPCRKTELRKIIADAELELASILLGEAMNSDEPVAEELVADTSEE